MNHCKLAVPFLWWKFSFPPDIFDWGEGRQSIMGSLKLPVPEIKSPAHLSNLEMNTVGSLISSQE